MVKIFAPDADMNTQCVCYIVARNLGLVKGNIVIVVELEPVSATNRYHDIGFL